MRRTNDVILTERALDVALRRHLDARDTGRRVRSMREAANVSQSELAAYVGVSAGTIYNIEHGRRAVLPAERAAIARALGVSIAMMTITSSNGTGRLTA
jgi:transcriptional regulator with XRE-family HTH domain